ncbi:MAG: hypothetical protein KJ613_00330 [Nanoarchaeota archaeon]|nr:hypothetical protein [Nanoarchaeota archaeon]
MRKKKNKPISFKIKPFLTMPVLAIIAILIILGCIGISTIGEGWFPVASEDASATSITIATGEACESCSFDKCATVSCPNTKDGRKQFCTKRSDDSGCECELKSPNHLDGNGLWCENCVGIKYTNCRMYNDCPGREICTGFWSLSKNNCRCDDPYPGSGDCEWSDEREECVGGLDCNSGVEKCLQIGEKECDCVSQKNYCGNEYNTIKERGGEPGEAQCYIYGQNVCPIDLTCIYYDTECADDYPTNPLFGGHISNFVCECTMPCESDIHPSQYSCGMRVPCCGNKDEYGNPDNECKRFNHFWPWDPPTQCYCEKYTL